MGRDVAAATARRQMFYAVARSRRPRPNAASYANDKRYFIRYRREAHAYKPPKHDFINFIFFEMMNRYASRSFDVAA